MKNFGMFLVLVVSSSIVFFTSGATLAATVLFEDNFDSATVGAFPDSPTVGTWSAVGTAATDVLVTDVDPPGPVSPPNCLSAYRSENTWTGAEANFARQTGTADLVRIEFDYYATSVSGSAGYINFQDKGGAGDLQYFIPRWDGLVLSGGGNLSGLVLNEWNHWVIDYMPGGATCDVTISGTLNAGVGMYGASNGIDTTQFATTYIGTDLIKYDNVEVTLLAESSLVTTLFEDDFDNATVGAFPNSPTVGTWSAIGTAATDVLVTDVDPPGPVSPPNCLSTYRSESTWTGAEANFTRQTDTADLVRIEFDYYATSVSGSAGYINFQDKGGAGDLQYFMPRSDGTVQSGGGDLSGLVLDEWNHWVIDYMPGAATCDVTISGTLNEGIEMYGTSIGIDTLQFATTFIGTDLIKYDNVKVTLNPVNEMDIPGDANKDGRVDGSDVTILAGNWQVGVGGVGGATWEMGDFNGDGAVDGSDVTILAGNWQHGVNTATASVPEPNAIVLLFMAMASLFVTRRR